MNAFDPELFICVPECLDPSYKQLNAEILEPFDHQKILLLPRFPEKMTEAIGSVSCHLLPVSEHYTQLSQKIKALLPDQSSDEAPELARLLIADDELGILEVLSDLFEGLGLEVFTAHDGQDALELLEKHQCNLVILDLRMPHLNGDEVVKKVFTDAKYKKPKQMMIVTASLGSTLTEVKRLGVPVLAKPVEIGELENSVLEACKKYQLTLKK